MNNPLLTHISPTEIAYAASLFVVAADRRFQGYSGLELEQEARCQKVYSGLIGSHFGTDSCYEQLSREVSLYGVFCQLWANHETESDQESICSRILAFHLLMEGTHGDVIQGWTSPIEETEEQVTLRPAVIAAIGSVRLCLGMGMCQKEFEAEIGLHAIPH